MADSKITALASISTSTDPAVDPLVIVDVSDTSMAATGTTKKVTLNQLLGSGGTATLASATITGAATVGTTLGVTGASTLTGNVGVGTTSSPWLTGVKAVDIGSGGLSAYSGGITHNAYYDNTDSRWEYKANGAAAFYNPQNGTHQWFIAASGLANAQVTNNFATAAMELNASGNLAFPTGKGIDFSANTPDGSGTVGSEVLNDYEEGTFTPNIGGTATYTQQTGRYTKIGNRVHVTMRLTVLLKGTGSAYEIAGLPFALSASSPGASISIGNFANLATSVIYISGYAAGSVVNLTGTTASTASITNAIAVIGNSTDMNISFSYEV